MNIEAEVMKAYADCNGNEPFEVTQHIRNLSFKASAPVDRNEACRIMRKAVPGGYNEFSGAFLLLLPVGSMVTIAREGSPAVYVTPLVPNVIPKMMSDEWYSDFETGTTRIWWN